MVSRIYFQRKINLDRDIHNYQGILAIESEVHSGCVYGFSDGKFAVIRYDGAAFCPIHETPILAEIMEPEIRAEILSVFEEWRPIYEKRKSM